MGLTRDRAGSVQVGRGLGELSNVLRLLHMRKSFTAVIERDAESGLYVGFVPGFPGAHSQGESLDELNANLREVIAMLLEDGEPSVDAEFVGTQLVEVG